MPRALSKVAPEWWDYTTLDEQILTDAAKLTVKQMEKLSRPGFPRGAVRHAGGFLLGRGVGIHQRLAAVHAR